MTSAAPSSASSPSPSPSTSRPPRNVAGVVGFSFAVAYVLIAVVLTSVTTVVPVMMTRAGADSTTVGLLFAVVGVGQLLLAVVVTVFGIVGLFRKDAPRVLAAIAVGVGGSGVVLGLASLILPPLVGWIAFA